MPKARHATWADRAVQRAEIVRRKAAGESRQAIAAALGISEGAVKNALEYDRAAHGEDVRRQAAAGREDIASLWRAGRSYAEIAEATERTEAEVRDRVEYARRLGDRGSRDPKPPPVPRPLKPPRTPKPKPPPAKRGVDADAVTAMAREKSTAAVAGQFGLTSRQVRRIATGTSQVAAPRSTPVLHVQRTAALDADDLRRRWAAHGKWKPIAEELGLTLPGLSEAMLRVFGQRPSDWLRARGSAAAPSAVRSAISDGAFDHLLGQVPDQEVADRAGVPVDQVARRRYRLRHLGRL